MRPVLEYASPVWHQFDYKETVRPDRSHSEKGHPHRLPLCTRHAMYKCHLPSWPAHSPPCQTAGTNLLENYSSSQSSPHPPYITFFPLLGNIHLSLDYESHQNILASPPPTRTKNNNHSSHMLSPTIRLHNCVLFPTFHCIYCFLCLFLCLLSTIVQPLAITFSHQSPIHANSKSADLLPKSITCTFNYLQIHTTPLREEAVYLWTNIILNCWRVSFFSLPCILLL